MMAGVQHLILYCLNLRVHSQKDCVLFFYLTDAIASAGGTAINYVDVSNGTDVTSYGNIIGSRLISGLGKGSSIIVYVESSKSSYIGYINGIDSSIIYAPKPSIIHRVFYI